VRWLLAQDVKALVVACNTATARALGDVREASPVPVMGVVRPGAVATAAATRSGHVGVIATAGTVESGAYEAAINEADPRVTVHEQACPDLVPLVEAGRLSGSGVEATVNGYLDALLTRDSEIDTLLLGCTHYPLLRPVIEARVGRGVAVVDSAFTTALATEDLLDALGARSAADEAEPMATGANRIATTGDVAAFTAVAERVFGARLPAVEAAEVAPH
jgi:glutamate racemase